MSCNTARAAQLMEKKKKTPHSHGSFFSGNRAALTGLPSPFLSLSRAIHESPFEKIWAIEMNPRFLKIPKSPPIECEWKHPKKKKKNHFQRIELRHVDHNWHIKTRSPLVRYATSRPKILGTKIKSETLRGKDTGGR